MISVSWNEVRVGAKKLGTSEEDGRDIDTRTSTRRTELRRQVLCLKGTDRHRTLQGVSFGRTRHQGVSLAISICRIFWGGLRPVFGDAAEERAANCFR